MVEWVKQPKDLLLPVDDPKFVNSVFVARKTAEVTLSPIEYTDGCFSLKNAVQRTYAARFIAKDSFMKLGVHFLISLNPDFDKYFMCIFVL